MKKKEIHLKMINYLFLKYGRGFSMFEKIIHFNVQLFMATKCYWPRVDKQRSPCKTLNKFRILFYIEAKNKTKQPFLIRFTKRGV